MWANTYKNRGNYMLKFTITRRELANKDFGKIINAIKSENNSLPDEAQKITVSIYRILKNMEETNYAS